MARARAKRNRQQTEIAQAIIAEWFRVLPESSGSIGAMDEYSLTAAFNDILDRPALAIIDDPTVVKIVVPLPPAGIATRDQLRDYLARNQDFVAGMSAAALFGCGR
ncbi:hypothetical protein NKI46_29425 [Mesorhizobium sp. M0615]|uniref:hypothetical protein n=1 Tax=unclassified Mesorhizobium TaxID=325217 RepID=UPI0003CEF36C|nr:MULTISPECIES: hypothetical protein [unclassified Mesorhizobium]ESY10527.1 hypothetical protein X752_14875 [Mesorhizobium sp. LNJC398B00]ESY35848.1 hypothetical protein X748_15420 [Mesorhizobium sp. LNJC386A00]ESZ38758.1 hypothetical protein X732_17755 [Mesorhizobium sp. L2C066B000]